MGAYAEILALVPPIASLGWALLARRVVARHKCSRLFHKTKVPVSKAFVVFESSERLPSERSTTLLVSQLICAMLHSQSSLSSMSKPYGLSQESALNWMRFPETGRSVIM